MQTTQNGCEFLVAMNASQAGTQQVIARGSRRFGECHGGMNSKIQVAGSHATENTSEKKGGQPEVQASRMTQLEL